MVTGSPLRAFPANNDRQNGPFSGPGASDDRIFFLTIKPSCVNILALSRPGSHTSLELPRHLATLRSHLARASLVPPLPSPLSGCAVIPDPNQASLGRSVLHYAFFPISQLFQASPRGPADLPDRTRGEAFACLHLLVGHWWKEWLSIDGSPIKADGTTGGSEQDGQVWRQLLILAAVTLTGPPPAKPPSGQPPQKPPAPTNLNSPETTLEVLKLLHALLCPRMVRLSATRKARPTPPFERWEWDGESDLPSLEEAEETFKLEAPTSGFNSKPMSGSVLRDEVRVVYPTTAHLKLAESPSFKSPLLHALTAALDFSVGAAADSSTIELRSTAIEVARTIATVWLPATSPASKIGEKLTPILPGVVSRVVRLLTGTPNSSDARRSSAKTLPGPLVARALMLLIEVVGPVLSDANTAELRAKTGQGLANGKVRTLEEVMQAATLADRAGEAPKDGDGPLQNPSRSASSSAHNTLKLTVQNLRLAMLSLKGRSLGSERATVFSEEDESVASHAHPMAQQALVKLSETLLRDCREALLWYERQAREESGGGPEEDTPLTTLLLRWLLDLASEAHTSKITHDLAQSSLCCLFDEMNGADTSEYSRRATEEVGHCLRTLPAALLSHRGLTGARLANRISSLLLVATSTYEQGPAKGSQLLSTIATSLQSQSEVERWGSKLVQCLQISVTSSGLADDRPISSPLDLPIVQFVNVAADEAKAVGSMLANWGRICATLLMTEVQAYVDATKSRSKRHGDRNFSGIALMMFFLDHARQHRHIFTSGSLTSEMSISALSTSSSALLIVREMTRGFALVLQDSRLSLNSGKFGKRARKQVHLFAEELIRDVVECWQEESQALMDVHLSRRAEISTADSLQQDIEKLQSGKSEGATEQMKGLPAMAYQEATAPRPKNFGPALNLSFVSAATVSSGFDLSTSARRSTAQSRQALVRGHVEFQRSVQLELLALSALLLGPAYQSHFMTTLYPMVSALTHPSQAISRAASRSLDAISYAAGYGDMMSCIRENVDYILGEASWRLVSGLGKELEVITAQINRAQSALTGAEHPDSDLVSLSSGQPPPLLSARTPPLVLTEVMRLLGPASLHLIEDSIDEVLDALDRFHGYDQICDALLGVLDRLLEVMKSEFKDLPSEASPATGRARHAWRTRNEDTALQSVLTWLTKRSRNEHLQSPLELPPAFDAVESEALPEEGEEETSNLAAPTSSSRSQKLLAAILTKALPFLSHSSAVIRARVLRLLGAGTQLLAPVSPTTLNPDGKEKWTRQEDTLLPLINRAWPLIVARLGWDLTRPLPAAKTRASMTTRPLTENESFVHLQALRLLEIFAVHISDFMGDRITKDAWPRIRLLLLIEGEAQEGMNRQSRALKPQPQTVRLLRSGEGELSASSSSRGQMMPSSGGSLKRIEASSPLYQLLLSTLRVFTPLLKSQGPRFPDEALWQLFSFPLYLACLDTSQLSELRSAAVDVARASKECDGLGTVWAVMRNIIGSGHHDDGRARRWAFLGQKGEGAGEGKGALGLDIRLAAMEILSR